MAISKEEADYILTKVKAYIDTKLADITDRGKVTAHWFEEKYMQTCNGGQPLDQSTFREYLRLVSTTSAKIDDTTASTTTVYSSSKVEDLLDDLEVQSDWNQTDTTELDYIKNKPDLTELATKEELANATSATEEPEVLRTDIISVTNVADLESLTDKSDDILYLVTSTNALYSYNETTETFSALTSEEVGDIIIVKDLSTVPSIAMEKGRGVYTVLQYENSVDSSAPVGSFTIKQQLPTSSQRSILLGAIANTFGTGSEKYTTVLEGIKNKTYPISLTSLTNAEIDNIIICLMENGAWYTSGGIYYSYNKTSVHNEKPIAKAYYTLNVVGEEDLLKPYYDYDYTLKNEYGFAKWAKHQPTAGTYTWSWDWQYYMMKGDTYTKTEIDDKINSMSTPTESEKTTYLFDKFDFETGTQPTASLANLNKIWLDTTNTKIYTCTYDSEEETYTWSNAKNGYYASLDNDKIYSQKSGTATNITPSSASTAIYIDKATSLLYTYNGSVFVGSQAVEDSVNAVHFYTLNGTVSTTSDLPAAKSHVGEFYNVSGELYVANKYTYGSDVIYYKWEKSSANVISGTTLYLNNGKGTLTVSTPEEDIFYINDATGAVYAWNGSSFVQTSNYDFIDNGTIYINYKSANKTFVSAITSDAALNTTKTAGNYNTIITDETNNVQSVYTLSVETRTGGTVIQYLSNRDGYYYRTFSTKWSVWREKETNYGHEKSFTLRCLHNVDSTAYSSDRAAGTEVRDTKIIVRPIATKEWLQSHAANVIVNIYRKKHTHLGNKWCLWKEYGYANCQQTSGTETKFGQVTLPLTARQLMEGALTITNSSSYNNNIWNVMKYGTDNAEFGSISGDFVVRKKGTRGQMYVWGWNSGKKEYSNVSSSMSYTFGVSIKYAINSEVYETMILPITIVVYATSTTLTFVVKDVNKKCI